MTTSQEIIKGGISIIWKIENYSSIQAAWGTLVFLEWPKTESKFTMTIEFPDINKNEMKLMILKSGEIGPFILAGSIFAVSEKFCFELKQLDPYNLSVNGNELVMSVKLIEYIDFVKQNFINTDTFTFRINLWDPNINDLIHSEYFIRSRYTQNLCSFQWMLNGNTDWNKNGEYTEASFKVPMRLRVARLTNNLREIQEPLRMKFKLLIKDNETFASIMIKDYDPKVHIFEFRYNLKFQKINEPNPAFLETGWSEFSRDSDNYLRKIIGNNWDYRSTKWVITIEIIFVTPNFGIIEKISYLPEIKTLKRRVTVSKKNLLSRNKLQQSLHNLYKEGEHCDIKLIADNKTFPCHKAVLCARSPVFKAMFENNMIEKETNMISINDVEAPILDMFLTFLYLDNLENKDFDSAVKLYEVADKYNVTNLIDECSNIIISSLCIENVCDILDLADSHQDDDLKKEIILYFYEHKKEIVNTSSWKNLLLIKPVLAAKTLQDVILYTP